MLHARQQRHKLQATRQPSPWEFQNESGRAETEKDEVASCPPFWCMSSLELERNQNDILLPTSLYFPVDSFYKKQTCRTSAELVRHETTKRREYQYRTNVLCHSSFRIASWALENMGQKKCRPLSKKRLAAPFAQRAANDHQQTIELFPPLYIFLLEKKKILMSPRRSNKPNGATPRPGGRRNPAPTQWSRQTSHSAT